MLFHSVDNCIVYRARFCRQIFLCFFGFRLLNVKIDLEIRLAISLMQLFLITFDRFGTLLVYNIFDLLQSNFIMLMAIYLVGGYVKDN